MRQVSELWENVFEMTTSQTSLTLHMECLRVDKYKNQHPAPKNSLRVGVFVTHIISGCFVVTHCCLSLPQLVPAEEYERWLQRGLSVAESRCEGSYHCATPDCRGWCVYEDTVNVFHCPVCGKHNCLICKVWNTYRLTHKTVFSRCEYPQT